MYIFFSISKFSSSFFCKKQKTPSPAIPCWSGGGVFWGVIMLLLVLEVVLSALHLAPVDGVTGAVVVAGKAVGALSVVVPQGRCSCDVIHGTEPGTKAALDAGILVNPELLVVDEVLVVVAADDVGIGAGNGSLHQLADSLLPADDHLGNVHHALLGSRYLPALLLGGVQMQERETDVRLGHDNGEGAVERDADCLQLLAEDGHQLAHVVAAGGEGIDVGGGLQTEGGATDELADDAWRLPSVGGEAETQALVVAEHVFTTVLAQLVGYVDELFASGFSQLHGRPLRVACT